RVASPPRITPMAAAACSSLRSSPRSSGPSTEGQVKAVDSDTSGSRVGGCGRRLAAGGVLEETGAASNSRPRRAHHTHEAGACGGHHAWPQGRRGAGGRTGCRPGRAGGGGAHRRGRPVRAQPGMLRVGARGAAAPARQAVLLPCPAGGDRAARAARGRLRDPGQQPRARLRPRGAGRHARPPGRRRDRGGRRVAVVGVTAHPEEFAAGPDRPGVAFADLRGQPPAWLEQAIRSVDADAVLVTPHWGPNMTSAPLPYVRRAAAALVERGATLVAGHSAHVFHGVAGPVLYDLGDFLDDYAVDRDLRNDLGLLFLVTLDEHGPARLEAVPLALDYCRTRLADGADAAWVRRRFRAA